MSARECYWGIYRTDINRRLKHSQEQITTYVKIYCFKWFANTSINVSEC